MPSSDRGIRILTIADIPVKIDMSWFIILVFVTWNLAMDYFPNQFEGETYLFYWAIGALTSLFLFSSILLHEAGHSVAARFFGINIKDITLFIFGGVAIMEEDPGNPGQELIIAAAGPFMSLILALFYRALSTIVLSNYGFNIISSMFDYIVIVNIGIIVFNLMPGLPLDGGRILRAILWKINGNIRKSTSIASTTGKIIGFILMAIGFIEIILHILSGFWLILIGIFLIQAAKMSYESVFISSLIGNLKVSDALSSNNLRIKSDTTVHTAAREYFMKHPHKGYPVIKTNPETKTGEEGNNSEENYTVIGFVTLNDLLSIPKKEWESTNLEELIIKKKLRWYKTEPDTEAKQALILMKNTGESNLIVMKDEKLVGIISYQDIMNLVDLRLALEEQVEKE
ncbi:MAG: site-2 protease family protein [Firmicutes bacterium]|nr:site-2 protease family protein [Bacillota bacterium]